MRKAWEHRAMLLSFAYLAFSAVLRLLVRSRQTEFASGIVLEAYSPLGHGRHIDSETATRIAQRLGRTPAQVLLRWCIERGVPLIAKSKHRDLIAENAQIFDFTLSDEDMADLDALDRTGGTQLALERKWW